MTNGLVTMAMSEPNIHIFEIDHKSVPIMMDDANVKANSLCCVESGDQAGLLLAGSTDLVLVLDYDFYQR